MSSWRSSCLGMGCLYSDIIPTPRLLSLQSCFTLKKFRSYCHISSECVPCGEHEEGHIFRHYGFLTFFGILPLYVEENKKNNYF